MNAEAGRANKRKAAAQRKMKEGLSTMSAGRSSAFALSALLTLAFPFLANPAEAGVGGGASEAGISVRRATPIKTAQYYRFDDQNYCWYAEGWQGSGWYWCGDEWDIGVGWGGPYGWNGWVGRRRPWRSGPHGIGTWHPRPPTSALDARPALGPGVGGGGARHAYHSGGAVLPGVPLGGAPAFHSLPGVGATSFRPSPTHPAFHGVSGGDSSFRSFGGGGSGFRSFGGGRAFSPGGHSGHGR
jgi:hypothetical protein